MRAFAFKRNRARAVSAGRNDAQPLKTMPAKKKGLYANISAKKKRIAKGSGEKMRKKGEEGAPQKGAFKKAAKTAKKK